MTGLTPAQQLALVMTRIYDAGMTTLSGGNVSIRERDGSLWVTPRGLDKSCLTADTIAHVLPDGTVEGAYQPSTELPFHRAIYTRRPDVSAIVHAHAPALVTYSIARKLPDTRLMPRVFNVVGRAGRAVFALPGSAELGERIAAALAEGYNAVILDNHGVVTVGSTVQQAYERLEALNTYARSEMAARTLGDLLPPPEYDLPYVDHEPHLRSVNEEVRTPLITEKSEMLAGVARRAINRGLLNPTVGEMSLRVDSGACLITASDWGLMPLQASDLVFVNLAGRWLPESGHPVPPTYRLHAQIYARHPHIESIITACPPYLSAYALTAHPMDTRSIPESYVMLMDAPTLPYASMSQVIAQTIGRRAPIVLLPHFGAVVTGTSALNAYDRLEVAEFSARSLIETPSIGALEPMSPDDLSALEKIFASWLQP